MALRVRIEACGIHWNAASAYGLCHIAEVTHQSICQGTVTYPRRRKLG